MAAHLHLPTLCLVVKVKPDTVPALTELPA